MSTKRVVLVGKDPSFRRLMEQYLSFEEGLRVFLLSGNERYLDIWIINSKPDVILFDLGFDEEEEIKKVRHFRWLLPKVKILVFSLLYCEPIYKNVIDAGGDDLICRWHVDAELLQKIT